MPDLGILDLANLDVPEQKVLPEGEHKVKIANVEEKVDKNGDLGYRVLLVSDEPNTRPISYYLGLPSEALRERNESLFNSSVIRVRSFVQAFAITSNEPTDWVGHEAFAIVRVTQSPEYGEQNNVRRFVVPK